MKTLVTAASRHGSTSEIADYLAKSLRESGMDADRRQPDDVLELTAYDTIVLGSAIYMGHWMKDAEEFTKRFSDALRLRQVWLFSSGPIGSGESTTGVPSDIATLMEKTGAVEHKSFAGKLDREGLGFGERVAVRVVHAPEGDFRDWASVRSWAESILEAARTTRDFESEETS